jgi:hypothetical protein
MHGEMKNAYKISAGKPEVKRILGRSRHSWENIKMDLKEMGVVLIHKAQGRDWWWAAMNVIINRFHERHSISRLTKNKCNSFINLYCIRKGDLKPSTTGLMATL